LQNSSAEVVAVGNADVGEEAIVVVAVVVVAAGELGVDDDAVALAGAAAVDGPRNPAVAEGTDSPEAVADGEAVEDGHFVLAVACTEADSHTGDRHQVQSAGEPVREVGVLGRTGLGGRPLVAEANTGDSEK
jgi:hypothetical protein